MIFFKMSQHISKKCILGFDEERILIDNFENSERIQSILNFKVEISKEDYQIRCISKPRLSESDKECGFYVKKGNLYNLNHVEVKPCIICSNYK